MDRTIKIRRISAVVLLASLSTPLAGARTGGPDPSGIVGGRPTGYESWKGVIALFHSGELACSGTLIDREVVLSAGHCVYAPVIGINYLKKPEALRIAGGADVKTDAVILAEVVEIRKHPDWKGLAGPDLSLLYLDREVTSVETYAVREQPPPEAGTPGTIVGYGLGDSQEDDSLGVHRAGDTTCLRVLETLIEVGDPAGPCSGDSGGPLLTEQDGQWTVTGVTSFGPAQVCDPMKMGGEVNVATYRDWIDEVVTEWTGHGLLDGIPAGDPRDDDPDSCKCAAAGARSAPHFAFLSIMSALFVQGASLP